MGMSNVIDKIEGMSEAQAVAEGDPKNKIKDIIFRTLKDSIKGHIYVTIENGEETDEGFDYVFVNIECAGVKYNYRLSLRGKTYEMVTSNEDYAATLAYMIRDNYKEFLKNKFFVSEKPKYKKKTQK